MDAKLVKHLLAAVQVAIIVVVCTGFDSVLYTTTRDIPHNSLPTKHQPINLKGEQ
ncbi:hypothetical protein L873DRAFT_1816012 [Choiromyces venosus 120613-1]|uniref:Uncharacterized protein n=1 Tax=Choiromyces venosus 120613-1 TaxID=1336337 RepID=A0A3N4J9P9_9PEZI|nr:hypothetical protein L873DRAFT_1816012 [Choiromyces venosus 120613-1]